MASVQNASAMAQGGAIIPPNLTQAQVQGMFEVQLPTSEDTLFLLVNRDINATTANAPTELQEDEK